MKHGHHRGKPTPTYISWQHMRARCLDKNHHAYDGYGGRGITVCARWDSFENFLADMGERPIGTSLDRKNNDLSYEPGNCRWATPKQQAEHRRPAPPLKLSAVDRTDIRRLLVQGLTGKYIASLYGVTPARISQVRYGR